ncbi:MAG TPA: transglutaminase domain-containing protein [Gammaproteobacteria bacterium]
MTPLPADSGTLRPAPPLLLAGGLLLWGWQNEFLPFALAMGAALESARWVRWRWPVSDREFNHLSDLSSVVLIVVVLYIFSTEGSKGIFLILAVLPFTLYPLVVVQVFSERARMKLSALFVSLRRLDPATSPEAAVEIDITLPYFILCLVSASSGNRSPELSFLLTAGLFGIMLWSIRPRRYHAVTCGLLILASIGLGFAGQIGLVRLQHAVEASVLEVMDRFMWRYRDPHHASTAIGMIGRLKQSDRIELRVRTDQRLRKPLLLRQASYDSYRYGVWSARRQIFTTVDSESSGKAWALRKDLAGERHADITTYMMQEAGVIPLPHGATRIVDTAATGIARNPYGAVSMDAHEGWIDFSVSYDETDAAADSAPTDDDLRVNERYAPDFDRLVQSLALADLEPAAVVAAIRAFFADGFTYSLTQRQRWPRERYLADFLFVSRAGHCEYFATSTVLLLRAAGVPARYAVGYAVDEFSPLEGQYIARARHAHSWALAWLDGRWVAVDTTPAVWAPLESQQASTFEPLFDLWAWVRFRFARWQSKDVPEEGAAANRDLLWLLIPLVGLLAWRLAGKQRLARAGPRRGPAGPVYPGVDSALYQLVKELEQRGHVRQPGETLAAWLPRCTAAGADSPVGAALALHYRYRFDPLGLSVAERNALDRATAAAIAGVAGARQAT